MPPKETIRTEVKVLIQPTQEATTDALAPQDLTITWSSSLFFVFTYYISIDNSMFWSLIFWDWIYYWWYIIYRHHFLFKLSIFLFPLPTNSYVFFETYGFSYTTQTPCHSGGTTSSLFFNRFCHIEDNVQLGSGESWGSKYC